MTSNLIRASKFSFWLIIVLVVLLLVVLPLLTAWLVKAGRMPLEWQQYLLHVETVQVYLMRGLGAAWLFFLGSCFASFLNVVAWRVPRGRGINGSSMCPFCESKLKFSDNLPIFGWIRNGGQCRTCRLPISPRYLIVEIILGCVFLMISGAEILAGGANLPIREIERLQGFEHLVFAPKWELIQSTIYHLILICLLFTFALIRSERLRIPLSIFLTGLVMGICLPLIWPSMNIVSWQIDIEQLIELDRFSFDQVLTISFGLVGGLACGVLVSWSTSNTVLLDRDRAKQSTIEQFNCIDDAVASMVMIGLFLGWQSALSVTLLLFVINLLVATVLPRPPSSNVNLCSQLCLATLIHLLAWRMLTWIEYWPGPTASNLVMIASIGILVVIAILMRMAFRHSTIAIEDRPGFD